MSDTIIAAVISAIAVLLGALISRTVRRRSQRRFTADNGTYTTVTRPEPLKVARKTSLVTPVARVTPQSFERWQDRTHPFWSNLGNWMALYVLAALCAFGATAIVTRGDIPSHPAMVLPPLLGTVVVGIAQWWLWRTWRTEYSIWVIEDCVARGDYVTASEYAFRLRPHVSARLHARTVVETAIVAAGEAGDSVRADALEQKLRSL